jgi:hypothetical protein
MIVNDPVVLAEAEDAFVAYETALMAYGLDALFWPSEPTVRIALGQNLSDMAAIQAFHPSQCPALQGPCPCQAVLPQ